MIKLFNERVNFSTLFKMLGVVVAYALLTKVTSLYAVTFGNDNSFYLANGLALAVLLIGGKNYIVSICLGALLADKLVGYSIELGTLRALVSALSVYCSYILVTRNETNNLELHSWQDFLWLMKWGAVGSLVSALLAMLIFWFSGEQTIDASLGVLTQWWFAEILGIALITVLALASWPISIDQFLTELPTESIVAVGTTFIMSQAVYWHWLSAVSTHDLNGYWMLPFIAWAAIRLGIQEMSLILLICVLPVLMTMRELPNNPLVSTGNNQHFTYLIYMLVVIFSGLALSTFIMKQKRENKNLFEQEEFYRMIAERTDDLIAVLDLDGRRIYNTHSYRRLFGDIDRMKGSECFNEIHIDDQDRIKRVFNDTVRFGIGQWTEFRFVLADGTVRNMESRGELLRNEDGNAKCVIVISRDITDRKRIEDNYRIANIAFESQDGMFITDVKNVILRVNRAFTEITGYSSDEVAGKTPEFLKSERQIEGMEDAINDSLNRVGAWRGEVWSRRKNGEEYLEQHTITVVRDEKGNITHYLTLLEDITQRKMDEEKIKQLAFHDPLTQLANRRKLLDRLKHSIAIGKREDKQMALLMVDIDRFKAINDIFGSSAGDELLQQVAGRLKNRLQDADLIARFGSDEFIIFLESVGNIENVSRIAEAIIFDLSLPFHLNRSNDVKIGINIGISLYPQHADSAEMLLEQADVALYQAKDAGRGGYVYFSDNFIRSL